jgi:hypothetical protein
MRFNGLNARSSGLYARARQKLPGEPASLAALRAGGEGARG